MNFEYLVVLIGSFLLGAAGAYAVKWNSSARLYSLEDRISLVEGSLLREVKTRAATERWRKQSVEEEAIAAALAVKDAGQARKPKWFEGIAPKTNGTGS